MATRDPYPDSPVSFLCHLSSIRSLYPQVAPCEVIVTSDFDPVGTIPSPTEIATSFTGPAGKAYVKVTRAATDGRAILDDYESLDDTPTADVITAHLDIASRCRAASPNSRVWLYGMPTKNDYDIAKGNSKTGWSALQATLHAGLGDAYDGYCLQLYQSRWTTTDSIASSDWIPEAIEDAKQFDKPLAAIVWARYNELQEDDSVDLVEASIQHCRDCVDALRAGGVRTVFLWENSSEDATEGKEQLDVYLSQRLTRFPLALF